jgi:hypothetical protein
MLQSEVPSPKGCGVEDGIADRPEREGEGRDVKIFKNH